MIFIALSVLPFEDADVHGHNLFVIPTTPKAQNLPKPETRNLNPKPLNPKPLNPKPLNP